MSMINPQTAFILKTWADRYPLPTTYCSIDLETTGLSVEKDHIMHLGWCSVVDGKTVQSDGVAVDWTSALDAPGMAKLSADMEKTREAMNKRGNAYRWTVNEMQRLGVAPRTAAEKFIAACRTKPLVAHNGWFYDYPMLARFLKVHAGYDFVPLHTDLMDTCLMARAVLGRVVPRASETYHSFIYRLKDVRCGKHSLRDCVTMFGLQDLGIDLRHAHDAEYDSWISALLLEKFRAIAADPNLTDSQSTKAMIL